jgi:glycosyltransferase involved in cell wall biosynthesis
MQLMNSIASQPLVSIVIATYNGARFLQEQLDSLAAQTYKNIEIIAVDDCSTDNTVEILKRYQDAHARVTVVRNERNLGYQKNFEKGFALANGNFIAPCDQDDIWMPAKLEVMLGRIGEHAIAYCNSALIDSAGQLTGECTGDKFNFINFDDPLMYVVGACAPGHAMLIKKQLVLDAMPFPTVLSHDNWLGYVGTFASSLLYVDQALVHYRRHDANVFNAVKTKRVKEDPRQRVLKAQQRMKLLYEKCPAHLTEQKQAYATILKSYASYSLANNFARMQVFFKYRKRILAHKRRNEIRRCLYAFKAFFKMM